MADTPMMQQYTRIKEQNADCILFFRLGDFYEMFGEDAAVAAKELDLVLTSRSKNVSEEDKVPMCGLPYHAADGYIARLLAKGYKVAICEQMEDPKLAKGLVERDIIRIITPGTAIESSMLDESRNNFIGALVLSAESAGLCFCDISTGEAYCTELTGADLEQQAANEFGRFSPSEALLNRAALESGKVTSFLQDRLGCAVESIQSDRSDRTEADDASRAANALLARQFGENLPAGLLAASNTMLACAGLLTYLYATQKTDLGHIRTLNFYEFGQFMELDYTARRNLELCETLRSGDKKGSLLWVLDRTKTPMGGRLIRSWLERPLINPAAIDRRLSAVEELTRNHALRDLFTSEMKGMSDMERIIGRVVYGSANARDLRSLSEAAKRLPRIRDLLGDAHAALLGELRNTTDELKDITELIDRAIVDDPPFSIREGSFIREGYSADVDSLREILSGGRGGVASIEAAEKERTGIKTLKVGYNRVFGYYIEVRKSGYDLIPDNYIRKQTLADRERYITEELKEMESTILTANERITALEYELFSELRGRISAELHRIQRTSQAIAQLDVLCSFAETAYKENYCRPDVDASDRIEIVGGRHPVVERMLANGMFVPNDTVMDGTENTVSIITGPNMAGKSTYMRQVALIVLMAQAGSFIPAKSARIGAVDRIFTRIGASDDLASGQSTFMVEMSEVADILRGATPRSLLILDEIGRGTSTFDGMAIARAVLEWVGDKKRLGAKTLFATHYHELTELEEQFTGVKNYNIAVKKRGKEIIFLRKIVRGGADDSYGIEVARLAGLPEGLIVRAGEILESLEAGAPVELEKRRARAEEKHSRGDEQISLLDLGAQEITEELRRIQPDTLTPIEALNFIYQLKKKVQ